MTMNAKSIPILMAVVALTLCAPSAWSQTSAIHAEGRVVRAGKAVPDAQVVLIHSETLRTYRTKTATDGAFSFPAVARGSYRLEVFSSTGELIYRKNLEFSGDSDAVVLLDIEVSGTSATTATTPGAEPSEAPKTPKPEASPLNALISQYNAALRANDPKAQITALKAIVATDPTRWDYFEALGDAQSSQEDYAGAVESFEKGVEAAQQFVSSSSANSSRVFESDRDRAKAGMAQMLTSEGNACLKLKKNDQAVAAYTKAAELSSNPATAYLNLCIMDYNTKDFDGALHACDKSIAADPSRADPYFIKGSVLLTSGKVDKDGKIIARPGAAEALKKYLELAPRGTYASQAKQILDYIAPAGSPAAGSKRP
jgi:tetratricopeptide (TPR) repeat protein